MRIIRILVVLAIAVTMLAPKSTLAAKAGTSNETKINRDINNIIFDGGMVKKNVLAIIPEVTLEKKREEVLAKYQQRVEQASFPQGKFTINASAYTAAADECGKSDGITASGLKVKEGETIACPPQFPFGTKVKIEGMGTYVCEDRGGAIKGNHFDIYVETKAKAFQFGRRNLEAEIVS